MRKMGFLTALLCLTICVSGCSADKGAVNISDMESNQEVSETVWQQEVVKEGSMETAQDENTAFTANTKIADVLSDPVFGEYGRLIFPVDGGYYSGDTLGEIRLTWYNNIDPDKTVEIVNYMKDHAGVGDTIFYDIYTEEEKVADPAKEDTGLFFFKGNAGERFAVCNAGGGFAYVGAMHDSFPHALELSKLGYNAFALIYRPGVQTACEDLARAISFIFEHAKELEVDTNCYSLWGGSAGARMAAYFGSYGTAVFGGGDHPKPGLGESGELLAEAAGTGNWLEGERFSSRASEETVQDWIESLGL